jgi:hypothetical protein
MITPVDQPLYADRWTPFVERIDLIGVDTTLTDFVMQVRLYPNAADPALLDFQTVTDPEDDGVYFEGVEYDGDGVPTSTIVLRWADVSTLPGNDEGDEPGTDTTTSSRPSRSMTKPAGFTAPSRCAPE